MSIYHWIPRPHPYLHPSIHGHFTPILSLHLGFKEFPPSKDPPDLQRACDLQGILCRLQCSLKGCTCRPRQLEVPVSWLVSSSKLCLSTSAFSHVANGSSLKRKMRFHRIGKIHPGSCEVRTIPKCQKTEGLRMLVRIREETPSMQCCNALTKLFLISLEIGGLQSYSNLICNKQWFEIPSFLYTVYNLYNWMIRVDLIHCLAPLLISPQAGLSSSSGVACKWESSSRVELKHDTGFVLPARNKAMTIFKRSFFNSSIDPILLTSSPSMIFWLQSPNIFHSYSNMASMPLLSLGTNLLLVVWAPFQWFFGNHVSFGRCGILKFQEISPLRHMSSTSLPSLSACEGTNVNCPLGNNPKNTLSSPFVARSCFSLWLTRLTIRENLMDVFFMSSTRWRWKNELESFRKMPSGRQVEDTSLDIMPKWCTNSSLP